MSINLAGVGSGFLDLAAGTPPQWGGISPHIIGKLVAWNPNAGGKDSNGNPKGDVMNGSPVVMAPVTDLNMELSLNWSSPFESSGPESRAPTMMAMLQSGQAGPLVNALGNMVKSGLTGTALQEKSASIQQSAITAQQNMMGKTGITKLNSTQVFSGMPPVKLSMTFHFRALANPGSEVIKPYSQLLQWALPKKLAANSTLTEVAKEAANNGSVTQIMSEMFPSLAPQLVCFTHGNNRYTPMVIEHMSCSLSDHLGITGLPIYRAVQISLSTLTALDATDVANILKKGSFL
jgi:hypothetical protein